MSGLGLFLQSLVLTDTPPVTQRNFYPSLLRSCFLPFWRGYGSTQNIKAIPISVCSIIFPVFYLQTGLYMPLPLLYCVVLVKFLNFSEEDYTFPIYSISLEGSCERWNPRWEAPGEK